MFDVELDSENGIDIILQWIDKWNNYDFSNFIPTMTDGYDTRILSYFWKNKYSGKDVFCKKKKECKYSMLYTDFDIVNSVLDRLLEKHNITDLQYQKTLSGFASDWMLKTKHFKSELYVKLNNNGLLPFCDDLITKINPVKPDFLRVFLANLLIPDLLDIYAVSLSDAPAYLINEKFEDFYNISKEIIRKYNLYDRIGRKI